MPRSPPAPRNSPDPRQLAMDEPRKGLAGTGRSAFTRSRARLAHLGVAAFTIGIVYSPAFTADTVRDVLRVAVVPTLAMSGLLLWALPHLKRTARRRYSPARTR